LAQVYNMIQVLTAVDLSIPDDQLSGAELRARCAAKTSNLQQGRQEVKEPSWGYGDLITADGKTKSSADGWLEAAVVGPYTLKVLQESESEDGATMYTTTHELYYNDKSIWKKSTWFARGMSGNFGSKHTAELTAAEDVDCEDIVITCELIPEKDHVQCINMAGSSIGTFRVPPDFDPYGHWLGEAVTKAVNISSARLRLASTSGEIFWSENKVMLTCVESRSGNTQRQVWLLIDGQMVKQDRGT